MIDVIGAALVRSVYGVYASHRCGSPFRHSFSLTESMLSLFGIGQPASSHLENLGNTKSRCKSSDFFVDLIESGYIQHTHTHLLRNNIANFVVECITRAQNNPLQTARKKLVDPA